jgi:hypothetical protein
MNDLEKYFLNNRGNMMDKWRHYFEIYDRHLSKYRGKEVVLVEFGIFHGGSLQMWKEYFGPRAKIYGIDINPECKKLEEEQVEVIIGDQEDRNFLQSLSHIIPRIDILIDDGGHTMNQQITTFEELYYCIDSNGVYICEDLHTSYWEGFQGGHKKNGTFIENSKDYIDHLNAWHSREPENLFVTEFTESTYSMHYYDSVLVIEKRPLAPPENIRSGNLTISDSFYRKSGDDY